MGVFVHKYFYFSLMLGFLLYVVLFIIEGNKIDVASCVGLFVFLSYSALLVYFTNRDETFFTAPKLAGLVFFYSIMVVALYYFVSDYYDGDFYVFSKIDALLYEKLSYEMIKKPFGEGLLLPAAYHWPFDDWGAVVAMSSILRIIPSKFFMNFVYILLGTVGSLYMLGLGRILMSNKMAFMASFSFFASSFFLFFHSAFLKESIFIFVVMGMFYHFYKYIEGGQGYHILYAVIFFTSIFFFRPAVAMFFGAGVTLYYLTDKTNKSFTYIILLGLLLLFIVGASIIVAVYNRYTWDGQLGELTEHRAESYGIGALGYVVNWAASFFGPFPSLLAPLKHRLVLYGPGLYWKMILSLPFLMGGVYIVRYKIRMLYPMLVFCLIEMVSLAAILQAFELRKGLPHYPILFLLAFWYMDVADDEEHIFKRGTSFWFFMVVLIVLSWNILRA